MIENANYEGKIYHLTAINDEFHMGLYKNGDNYLVANEKRKIILQFKIKPEITAQEAARHLGYRGY